MVFTHLLSIAWAPALVLLAQGAVISWTHLYWTFPWLDIPAHFLGGASIAIAGGNAISFLNAAGRVPFLPRFFSVVCVLSFVALAAVAWEWFEFLGDYLIGTNMQATIQAIEVLDRMLGQISDAVLAKEGMLLITADHGNAEVILNPQTGEIDKEHNASPVPFIAISSQLHGKTAGLRDTVGGDLSLRQPAGVLADVAPTVLKILDLPIPPEMTGRPLL